MEPLYSQAGFAQSVTTVSNIPLKSEDVTPIQRASMPETDVISLTPDSCGEMAKPLYNEPSDEITKPSGDKLPIEASESFSGMTETSVDELSVEVSESSGEMTEASNDELSVEVSEPPDEMTEKFDEM